jgi:hypothetical protein
VTANPLRQALAAALLLALAATAAPLAAQGVRLRDLDGSELGDADLAHGATIAVIWASWSPRSRDIVERVNPLAVRWHGQARVVTVDFQEDRAAVEKFLAGKGLTVPVFLDTDGAFSKKYAVATLPGLLVVKDGQVTYHGRLPDDPERAIAEALK